MPNNYKPKEVEIKTESIDNNIADSDALDKALDKMLANKKLIVKFKHKNPKNDEIKVIHAVDIMHSNDSITPINLYESVNDSPDRITKETAEKINEINKVDKQDMKMKQIDVSSGNDYENGTPESKDIPELLMDILKKKVRKEPVLRNEFVLKNKNVQPHRFVVENPQSHEENICKKVSHGRQSNKVPINAELTDYEDNNYEKKLNEYYKTQLQERRVVNQVVPSMSVEDSFSTENYSFKKKQEARKFKTKKDRKKHKRNKRAHKQKKKKDSTKEIIRTKRSKTKNILRNRDNNLLSLSSHKPDVLDTIEIKIANPIPGRKRPKKEKHHAEKYNDPYGRMTNYEEYESTTRKPKVKKIHSSSNIASSKVKKHKDEVKFETSKVPKNKDYHESSGIAKSISWDSSEDIDPEDLTRTNHEKKDLNSYEELLRENEIKKHPQLPFYISTPKPTTLKKKYTKKELTTNSKVYHKILMVENTTTKLDTSPLRHKEELQKHYKIDMNATLQQLASSTMLDMLTEKIAAQMLEKLQKRLEQHGLRALGLTEQENDSVEHIEILFSNDGNMQIVSNRKDDLNPNVNGTMFYFDAKRRMYPAIY